jgi:sulfur relay (sulfurtransferase) DsrC/TusE family protein
MMTKIKRSELKKGIAVEKEHKKTLIFIKKYYKKNKKFPTMEEVAKQIVYNHESEAGMRNRYYTALASMEKYLKETK